MVEVFYEDKFLRVINKIKDRSFQDHIKKLIEKVINNPETGKPMRYERQGTREVHTGSFRLSYIFLKTEDRLVFLNIYHKDEQ